MLVLLMSVAQIPRSIAFHYRRIMAAAVKQPVCLIVIDGWGVSDQVEGNAIKAAHTPVMDALCAGNACEVEAHGLHVGLPEGLMGNSEVGHLNIGAGRVVYQDIVRIDLTVKNNQLVTNEAFLGACNNAKAKTGRLHLLGLVSDGGVHSHIKHLFGMLRAAKELGVPKCFVQYFGDGRDTQPDSGVRYVADVLNYVKELGYGELAGVVGRYYAMDRDKRWERMQVAYEGLVAGRGEEATADTVIDVIKKRYEAKEFDEFLKPIILNKDGCIKPNDTLVFIDFRADRMRQIAETFGVKRNFETDVPHPDGLHIACMTRYNDAFPFPLLFPPVSHTNVLAEWLCAKGVPQYHCAETEKYAHVTFFFNGGQERQFDGEERCLVPSPKVATYDLQPEMSCAGVADKMCETIASKKHPFVMCNFAPPDMVGHTGFYEPAVKACTATDVAIGRIKAACLAHGYVLFVTADHGNAEKMVDETGGRHTAHTCNRVPFVSTGQRQLKKTLPDRELALRDVATTCLDQMGLDLPKEMDGVSLLQ